MNTRKAEHQRKRIPSAGPSITEIEVRLVTEAARDGWYENMSRYLDEFEERFASYLGVKYCMATSNGTSAIHLALAGLNIGPGDEVIVPDITWVASAAPVLYVGAIPVFADVDPMSWCLTAESFERAITPRTKSVVVVGLLGNMPDMDEIRAVAERHKIPIVEDAAESIGATYKGRLAGTHGKVSIFSFTGTKLMVTGEGGMIATDDEGLHERFQRLSHHGIVKKPGARYYWSHELGYKYKMSNIQAALGLAQLQRIDELVEGRRRMFKWYEERLGDLDGVQLNHEAEDVRSTFWITTAIVDREYGLAKEQMVDGFQEANIDGRPFFYPLSSMPTFTPYCSGRDMARVNPVSYDISPRGICLPSAASLTESDVEYVCQIFRDILAGAGARLVKAAENAKT